MFFETTTVIVILIIFSAVFTRSAFGFGDAMIAMPLLTIAVGIRVATPLVALAAFSTGVLIIVKNWRKIQIQAAWRLIISSIIGIPAGLLMFKYGNDKIIKSILAIIIITFSLFNLIKPRLLQLNGEKYSYLFGLIAGVLGGAYNINGLPVAIYATLRRWNPESFRATMQGYFLPTGFCIAIGHGLSGLWTKTVLAYYLLNLPFVIAAVILGGILNRIIPGNRFINYIYFLLIFIGGFLLFQTISG